MACGACANRSGRGTGRIVPVTPDGKHTRDNTVPVRGKPEQDSAKAQGTTLRSVLRYTGR